MERQDTLRPWVTDNSDPATAANGMSFKGGPDSGVVTVGGGVKDIQVEDGETVIGTHGVLIHPKKEGTDWAVEDPKFNGFGGKHPQIDR